MLHGRHVLETVRARVVFGYRRVWSGGGREREMFGIVRCGEFEEFEPGSRVVLVHAF
jgi:hypothetical protein